MTEEERDRQKYKDQAGGPEITRQGSVAEMLTEGAEAASRFIRNLHIPDATTETVLGTILGCLTVRAFTKAWPRLETPVSAAGYAVGGYAVYRLAKAAFSQEGTRENPDERR